MKEIIWHGRGGQGAVVAARVLAIAFDREGKAAMAFPKFGSERRGAPVSAFTAFDDRPIRQKTQLYNADCLIVMDSHLMKTVEVFKGIKPGAILVLNAHAQVDEQLHRDLGAIGTVDATRIGLEEIGRPITNSAILGAFARATGWVRLDSILSGFGEYFSGTALSRNVKCAQRGYEETRVTRF